MLHLDIPTLHDIKALNAVRADACISIYLETTPITQESDASRTALGNLYKEAAAQLQSAGFDKRRLAALAEQIEHLENDTVFWRYQANTLAILATPDTIKTFRLANRIKPAVQVSDRFHLKPLLRAITFPHACFVLALSENNVRLIEIFADMPPQQVNVPGLPESAAAAFGKTTLNDRGASGRIQGAEGQNVRFTQYARAVDNALRPVLSGHNVPLILAATGRLESTYQAVNSYAGLLPDTISTSPDRLKPEELAARAQPVLDKAYSNEIAAIKALYQDRINTGRATTDLSDAARAATYGAIDTLLIDLDHPLAGWIDEQSGALKLAEGDSADSYGIIDEIAGRALSSGARVLSVRREDLPDQAPLAAILRFAA